MSVLNNSACTLTLKPYKYYECKLQPHAWTVVRAAGWRSALDRRTHDFMGMLIWYSGHAIPLCRGFGFLSELLHGSQKGPHVLRIGHAARVSASSGCSVSPLVSVLPHAAGCIFSLLPKCSCARLFAVYKMGERAASDSSYQFLSIAGDNDHSLAALHRPLSLSPCDQ